MLSLDLQYLMKTDLQPCEVVLAQSALFQLQNLLQALLAFDLHLSAHLKIAV